MQSRYWSLGIDHWLCFIVCFLMCIHVYCFVTFIKFLYINLGEFWVDDWLWTIIFLIIKKCMFGIEYSEVHWTNFIYLLLVLSSDFIIPLNSNVDWQLRHLPSHFSFLVQAQRWLHLGLQELYLSGVEETKDSAVSISTVE